MCMCCFANFTILGGLGLDRKICFTVIYRLFVGLFVYFSELHVHFLGYNFSGRVHAVLYFVYAARPQTPEKKTQKIPRRTQL